MIFAVFASSQFSRKAPYSLVKIDSLVQILLQKLSPLRFLAFVSLERNLDDRHFEALKAVGFLIGYNAPHCKK
jgi:hypothetical protein